MSAAELDRATAAQLATLPPDLGLRVGRHLVMAGRLLDEDADAALAHARAARRLASRVAVVREAVGVTAYAAGEYAEALAELRAARRMAGADDLLPMIADCERGLGRPERALELLHDPAVGGLDQAARAELLIVAAGARRDLGQDEAAVLLLRVPGLNSTLREPWVARLQYAYADALLAVGRLDEARRWFARAADADADGGTDAADRLAALDGTVFVDALADGDEETGAPPAGEDLAGDGLAGDGPEDGEA